MSRASKILILLAVFLIIIVLLIWLFFLRGGEREEQPPTQQQPTVVEERNNEQQVKSFNASRAVVDVSNGVAMGEQQAVTVNNLTKTAAVFAEKFGSYSNQEAGYDNIRDLRIFMTDAMKVWSERFIVESGAKTADDIYYGVTTKALSSKMINFNEDEARAEIMIKTQRREAIGDSSNFQVNYQDIKIIMKKVGDIWKVDGAYWQ